MKPPKLLYVSNSIIDNDPGGEGHVAFPTLAQCSSQVIADQVNGVETDGTLWIYQLKEVKQVVVTTLARKRR